MNDHEIQEIRRIRHQISAKYEHDLKNLAKYYQCIEKELQKTGKYSFVEEKSSYAEVSSP